MSLGNAGRRVMRPVFMAVLLVAWLLLARQVAGAQPIANPTGETAVSFKNASSYFLIFFIIDGENKGGVPCGRQKRRFCRDTQPAHLARQRGYRWRDGFSDADGRHSRRLRVHVDGYRPSKGQGNDGMDNYVI